ncbi:phospholipid-binding protein [Amorphus sp. MBR-141]
MRIRSWIVATGLVAITATAGQAADFSFAFAWGDFPRCTTGRPLTVASPAFELRNVPQGAASIRFKMVDLAVPNFNHGGGKVAYSGGSTIAPGAFKYSSPCPPNGTHTYEWTADVRNAEGKSIAKATARKKYP